MKNKIIGYILIMPFTAFLFFFFIILPFMALTNKFFGWFSNKFYILMGAIILVLEMIALALWLTDLGFSLLDKEIDKERKIK